MTGNSEMESCGPKPLKFMVLSIIGVVLAGFSCLLNVFTGLVVYSSESLGTYLVIAGILVNLQAWSSYRPDKHTQSSNITALVGLWICLITTLIMINLGRFTLLQFT